MRIACVNADAGIDPGRKKGAAVHLRAVRRALEAGGAEVVAIDEPDATSLRRALETLHEESSLDLVYERLALGARATSAFCRAHAVAHILEINAPLAEEEARWRDDNRASEAAKLEAQLLSEADHVVAVSSAVADYARRCGAPDDRLHVFPNGVDPERFLPRWLESAQAAQARALRDELVPAGRFALGFHGRLRPWHGFDRWVRVAEELFARNLPVHFVLVGEGPFEDELAGHVPAGRFTRVAWADHDLMGRYVATFDALPLTYPPDAPCYFSPLKLAEAMACGVVPLVPDLADLAQVVEHGKSGIVYPADRLEVLVDAIERLIQKDSERVELARGARLKALTLGWDRIADFILQVASESSSASSGAPA